MFTGIVKGAFSVASVKKEGGMHYAVSLPEDIQNGLEIGASVSVDGVCQTVVKIDGDDVYFDAIDETLRVTTLAHLKMGDRVNIERSLRYGDEVGGHLLSGHVLDTAVIIEKEVTEGETIVRFDVSDRVKKYLFLKGYIAIDGVSLTIVDVDPLSVHLIPETLRMTTLGFKQPGDRVNVEIDQQTQAVVETLYRMGAKKKHS